jgi:hypothetical protein
LVPTCGLCLLLIARAARAEQEGSYDFRVLAGVGGGNVGLAGRVGVSADRWLSPELGVGLQAGLLGQTNLLDTARARQIGPQLSWRHATGPEGAWLFSLSPGYARMRSRTHIPCPVAAAPAVGAPEPETEGGWCLWSAGSRSRRAHAGYASLEVGHQYEGPLVLAGLSFRGDVVGWPGSEVPPQLAITLNLLLGLNVPSTPAAGE